MNNETIVIYCADTGFSWVESFLQHWTITSMLFESWLREDTREFTASVQRIGMTVVPVKEEKRYKYWDVLLSKILKAHADDKNCIVRHVEVSPKPTEPCSYHSHA